MRNMLKATTLEISTLAVENGCIISKDAEHNGGVPGGTARTVHRHQCQYNHTFGMVQGNKGAADYSIVHKQDFFIKGELPADTGRA